MDIVTPPARTFAGRPPTAWQTIVLIICGLLLELTGILKVISSFGDSEILGRLDPIVGVTFQRLFLCVGVVEIGVGAIALLASDRLLRAGVIAAMASALAAYRLGMWLMGYVKPCSCLGEFAGAVGLSDNAADTMMKCALLFMLLGSYAVAFPFLVTKRS